MFYFAGSVYTVKPCLILYDPYVACTVLYALMAEAKQLYALRYMPDLNFAILNRFYRGRDIAHYPYLSVVALEE